METSQGERMSWEELRKIARQLENEIDLKLVSFSKLGAGHRGASYQTGSDTTPLLGDDTFEEMQTDLEQLLSKLSSINEQMGEFSSGQTQHYTQQRHKEVLQDYKQEFTKTKANFQARREREDLLNSVRKDIDNYRSGLNRRMDLYLKENEHIRSSERLLDDQISIAVETREHLMSQRLTFKKFQTKMNDLSNRFPLINSISQRIMLRKRRDAAILGVVVAVCIIVLFLYAFR
ncbi:Golgi SNAP receptor complex member 1 [Hetaerina americana]|uniref:Golgi SNAP receptor complex member 1 n=1 Tax=Hetaerina americana TaxID=62018 RepID=UPI003A7F1E09